jgi:hypothetical protein
MQNLNNAFSMTKGFGMIGKYAVGQITNEDTGNTGSLSTNRSNSIRKG